MKAIFKNKNGLFNLRRIRKTELSKNIINKLNKPQPDTDKSCRLDGVAIDLLC